jgi:hypothetical protein
MIKFILMPGLIMLSCGSVKSNQSAAAEDSVIVSSAYGDITKDTLPKCIQNKIDSFKVKAIHERPQKIVEYMYKGKKVYYVVSPCCDFFNEVYDDKCNFLGSPDGGFTGKGDGKLPDFFTEAKNEKLIWEAAK